MVKTHLPAHMDSVRQKCRPKHQLLILKCYPRLPKNSAADVKPNGSELSYLLYYASTRRSKLQKVGLFLERKTASDVSRYQSARVVVTLQILTALLENKVVGAGSGFALIAPHVLKIIREMLRNTSDISLIEASLAMWDVFCRHQDQATLAADHEYRGLYEDVVRIYAGLAHKEHSKKLGKGTQPVAVHDAIRLRETGLGAMKSILLSDALASESGRQLNVTVPAIMSNMRGDDEFYLRHLVRLSKRNEDDEKEKAMARRQSIATVRTHTGLTDNSVETDPRQAEGTVQDADEFAEEGVAILALECLKAVFSNENRPQVRSATSAVLKYFSELQLRPKSAMPEKSALEWADNTWATKLFEICTAWTPVQDRFVLMVTAVETLVRMPLRELDLQEHLLYTNLIDHILRSDLNLIGLSVMDALLGLIQQILRVLQLNGPLVGGRSSAAQLFSSDEELKHPTSQESDKAFTLAPSEARIRLTERLKHCIADLGTHVYYTDQVSDMLSAILLRLKPNPAPAGGQQNPAVTAAAIEEPRSAVAETASNVSLPARERSLSQTSGFFSFDMARQIALEAVRDTLQVANSARSISSGGVAESRNKVPISIWEGTQWLLRDPSPAVRRAYVDALTTWLQLETKKSDARIKEPKNKVKKKVEGANGALARRAVSNASQKDRASKKATSTFLQLLHLAVYENALQYAPVEGQDAEKDLRLLHLVLFMLVKKLGVNAVQSGLPMIFALQEESGRIESRTAKVRIGSLVYGYFWALSDMFDFYSSVVGREILGEVSKRKEQGLWMNGVSVPPMPSEQIHGTPLSATNVGKDDGGDAGKAFEHRQGLVDRIADAYSASVASPPPSAPASPGRSPGRTFTGSALDRNASSYLTVKASPNTLLPDKVKSAMMESWTREGCLAAIAAAAPKSVSLSGSRSSPSQALAAGNHRQLLAAANTGPGRKSSLPTNAQYGVGKVASQRQQIFGARLRSQSPDRRPCGTPSGRASSSAGMKGTVRVDDLKRVLAGSGAVGVTNGMVGRFADSREDTASESMVDVDEGDTGSDSGFSTPPCVPESGVDTTGLSVPEAIPEDAPAPSAEGANLTPEKPPALRLPSDAMTDGHLPPSSPAQDGHVTVANGGPQTTHPKPPPSRGGTSLRSKTRHSKKDLKALLAGVGLGEEADVEKDEGNFGGMGRPPY